MLQCVFTKAVELAAGRIGLTKDQAAVRSAKLQPIEKGVYEILGVIQFKAGEAIGLEDVPKSLRSFLDDESEQRLADIERRQVEAEARARLEAEAKAEAEKPASKKVKK